jgi:RND superfamily putative drug exporter
MIVVVNAPPGSETEAALRPAVERASHLPGVERLVGPRSLGQDAVEVQVTARVDPLSDRAQALLREVRAIEWPYPTLVSGRAADLADQKDSLRDHLPLAVAIIVLTTFVAIFLMTGSVVLPVKALVMNVLTISAAFGIIVLVFQDGRLESLLDYTSQGALDTSIPVLLFAVAFGLSTDYGVFLLARIKEAHDSGAPNREAVATGLERTGRLVTAAALIFAVAIGAFVASELAYIKEIAIGLAVAVLLDATIVRALLVPALMELLGKWNWWAPAPLERLHRTISA